MEVQIEIFSVRESVKMGKLIYTVLTSLDGYTADAEGNFHWAEPEEDVHIFINKLELKNEIILCGRKMYEILSFWENLPEDEKRPDYIKEYQAAWKKAKKIVFSSSLKEIKTANTILKTDFNRAELEALKKWEPENIGIGGAELASQAFSFGQIDEIYRFLFPVMIGSGKRWLECEKAVNLRRIESREFSNGVVMLHYSVHA